MGKDMGPKWHPRHVTNKLTYDRDEKKVYASLEFGFRGKCTHDVF